MGRSSRQDSEGEENSRERKSRSSQGKKKSRKSGFDSVEEAEIRVEDSKASSDRRKKSEKKRLEEGEKRKRSGRNEDWQIEKELHHTEPEKHVEKKDSKPRYDENDKSTPSKNKLKEESKSRERSHSREGRGSHREDHHKDKDRDDSSRKDKYRDDRDRGRDRHDKYRDEGSHRDDYSRERSSSRSHGKHYKEEKKSEKRSRHHDSDYDGGSPYRDGSSRGRKRYSDERDDAKSRGNSERSASNHLDAQEGHPKSSPPSRLGEGSSFPEERERRINESAPLTEKPPPSPLTRGENFSGGFPGHVSGGRYKHGVVDMSLGRAAGGPGLWKGGPHGWPGPGVNGFLPFQPMPPSPGFLNQCPPPLFGVRPGVVPFQHLHEPRPFLWPGPADGWDDDPRHMYGRQPATWEPKVEAAPAPAADSTLEKDATLTQSAETAQIPSPEAEVNEESTSQCAYLAMLDISPVLAGPELFSQCADLARDEADVAEFCVATASRRHGTQPGACFPPLLETVFEKAMSLYKKQSEDWKSTMVAEKPVVSEDLPNEEGKGASGDDAVNGGEVKKCEEKGLVEEPGGMCVNRIHGVSQSTR